MTDIVFLHDGTLDGCLTAVFEAYSRKIVPSRIISAEENVPELFTETVDIIAEPEKAERVLSAVRRDLGDEGVSDIRHAFASCNEDKGRIIFSYLRSAFRHGSKIKSMYNLPEVSAYNDLVNRVGLEVHRMLGFIRFRELRGGILYAKYEPDNDITDFLMPYFVQRNAEDLLIIHDARRNVFGLYNRKEWISGRWEPGTEDAPCEALSTGGDGIFSDADSVFAGLWKQYYGTVTIASRKNERVRRQYMPRRYWKYLFEVQNE